jgi:(R)-2-hydroxyacyl-CoA dehydratese activating ATPase
LKVLGIDIGAATAKAVILEKGKILSTAVIPTGYDIIKTTEEVTMLACNKVNCSINDFAFSVSTGYARNIVPFSNKSITEITCQAKGIHFLFNEARTIIDIGGQDNKVIRINESGSVINFTMNDKCAAGTGRFFEVMASVLGLKIDEIGPLAIQSNNPCHISSTCTVFAETEVISLRAQGKSREDLVAGIHKAMVLRLMSMIKMIGFEKQLVFTGGVARNIGIRKFIEDEIESKLLIPEDPQITAALGAALFAEVQINQDSSHK